MDTPDFMKPPPRSRSLQQTEPILSRKALKRETQKALRNKIDGSALLMDLVNIANILHSGYIPMRQHSEWVEISLDRTRIASLKASADIKLKLLNKILPDLANMQLSTEDKDGFKVILSGTESQL